MNAVRRGAARTRPLAICWVLAWTACGNSRVASDSDSSDAAPTSTDVGVPVADASNEPACHAGSQDDPHNCGACGNDCRGAACQAGTCASLPAGVLASGQLGPIAIALDAVNLYWLNLGNFTGPGGKAGGYYANGQVMKCAIAGCNNAPTMLASGWTQPGGLPVVPSAIAVDATSVYWTGSDPSPMPGQNSWGWVLSCAVGGCNQTPTIVASGQDDPTGVAAGPTGVYWTMYSTGQVANCPVAGAGCGVGPTTLATGQVGPSGIAVDDANVYWTSYSGHLTACALSGCGATPTNIWTGQPGSTQAATTGIAVDAIRVYWTNGNPLGTGSVMQCDKEHCPGTLTTLATGRNAPGGIAVDDAFVYWTEIGDFLADGQASVLSGGVFRCAINGCNGQPTALASNLNRPSAIAVDATHIYWTDVGDGQIMMLAK
jgi:hypothetical protein